jgi:hypothetical protein
MRRGGRIGWASVTLLLLFFARPIGAQGPDGPPEHLPPPVTGPLPGLHDDGLAPMLEGGHTLSDKDRDEPDWLRGLSMTADYLLIRPRRNALDFAVRSPLSNDAALGSIESVRWETRSGFRYGAGWLLPDEKWQVGISYTYFYSAGNRNETAPPGGQLFATLTRAGSVDDVAAASAFTSLNYNVIDLDATRIFYSSDSCRLQVFGGGRFAWIDQKLDATYSGGSSGPFNTTVTSPVFFNGGGLSLGGEGVWQVWHNVGLYGRGRFSLLSGRFRNFLTETTANGAVGVVNVQETNYQIVPVAELGAGVTWQGEHWRLSVGYELANWFSMVNSPDFTSPTNIGKLSRRTSDLTLEGLAVQLGFLF